MSYFFSPKNILQKVLLKEKLLSVYIGILYDFLKKKLYFLLICFIFIHKLAIIS